MKYSFVIPVYKARFLKAAIDSILLQTETDFELIIVNDASPEDIDAVVVLYDDPRLTYYKNAENIGRHDLVASWHHAMQYATGEYLVVASDDDIYTPDYLEQANKLIAQHPECDLIRGRVAKINELGTIFDYECQFEEYQTCEEFTYQLLRHGYKCASCYMYKREAFIAKGGFVNFPVAWYTDVATPLNMSRNGVLNMQRVSFHFRISSEHLSANQSVSSLKAKLRGIQLFQKWQEIYFKQLPCTQTVRQAKAGLRLDIVSVLTHHMQHIPLLYIGIWWKHVILNPIFFQYEKAEAIASRVIYLFRKKPL